MSENTRDTSIADFLKAIVIHNKGFLKNSLTVDEVGLPLNDCKKKFRADVYELNNKNKVTIYEIKSSKQDFLSDYNKLKYLNYKQYCNYFYFVIPEKLYEFINEKLYDEKNGLPELNKGIGLYVVYPSGLIKCKKRSRDFESIDSTDLVCIENIREKVNIQLKYRYFKHTYENIKKYKKDKDKK